MNERVKPPKHLSLPVTVHHWTGSTQLVQLLNRFGHAISVSQLQRLETAIAQNQLSRNSQLSRLHSILFASSFKFCLFLFLFVLPLLCWVSAVMSSVAHAHSMIERFPLFVYLAVCPSICSYALHGTAVVTLFLVLLL